MIEAGSVDQLTVVDGANRGVRFNGFVFEVGDSLTYGDNVDGYLGMDNATLTLNESGGNIWLNGWNGQLYGNIRVLDGSAAWSNETLVGGSYEDNVLVGGCLTARVRRVMRRWSAMRRAM